MIEVEATPQLTAGGPRSRLVRALRRNWGVNSANRRILSATAVVGATTCAVYGITALKETVVARWFGRGDALEAYLVAFAAQQFLVQVLASSFNPALIPAYIRLQEEKEDIRAQRLFSAVGALTLSGLLICCLTLGLFAAPIFRLAVGGFGAGKLALTTALFTLMLPAVVLRGQAKLWAAVLNARAEFALAAIAPVWTPLFIILLLWRSGQSGIYVLIHGTLAGAVAEVVSLGLALKNKRVSIRPSWHRITPEFRCVIKQYLPMVVGTVLMSGTVLVDQSMAALLPRGSVATLGYANNITFVIQSVSFVSLSTAVLPFFSQMIARNDWAGISRTLKTWSLLVLITTIPITLILLSFSDEIVRLAYQRGAFRGADTLRVAQVLRFYLLQLPFYVTGSLVVRLLSSMEGNAVLMWITGINLVIKIGLNMALLKPMGASGIALSTSVMYACSLFACFTAARRMLAQRQASRILAIQ